MSELQERVELSSGCCIYTHYPLEEYTFKWNITNFSKIFNNVSAQFSTPSNTKWQVKLVNRSAIELWRCFEGETVRVDYVSSLVTSKETLKSEGKHSFTSVSDHCKIMDLRKREVRDVSQFSDRFLYVPPIPKFTIPEFENDILSFQCTLTISGHSVTNKADAYDIAQLNSKQLSEDLRDFFKRQEHCDLTLTVGENKIQVHKAILCARSRVFDRMFRYSVLESDQNQIEITDIDFDVLQDFLLFLYSGEVKELTWDSAIQLYYAADKYEVTDLRAACNQFLEFHLSVDNVCYILRLADLHNDEKLKRAAKYFAQMNSSMVMSTEDWRELLQTDPKLAVDVLK